MGRKRKAGVMLPKHVHKVTWASGTVAYYYQRNRATPKAGLRTRLPDDPQSDGFWRAIKVCQEGPKPQGSLSKMIEAYLASPHYAALAFNTRREYDRHMDLLSTVAKGLDASELQISDVAGFRDELGDTPAKANAFVRAIAAAYAWGCERGFAQANPATGIRKLKIGEIKPWSQEIWNLAVAHFRPEIRTACYLGRFTGQRLGDVLRMKLTDIKDDGFEVVQQKTGKALFVPVRSELVPIIAGARKAGRICIVSRPDGSPFTVDQFHAMWGREMKNAALAPIKAGGFSFHGLRKMNVVAGAEGGLTGHEIGSITGQTLATVEHYARGAAQKTLAKAATRKLEENGK